jgi:hypothetical protein
LWNKTEAKWNILKHFETFWNFLKLFETFCLYKLLFIWNETSSRHWIFRVYISFLSRLGSRFEFPVAKLVRYKPSVVFKLTVFWLSHAHVHEGICLKTKKSLLLHGWLISARFLFAHLFTQIVSHEQPWRPNGQPA